MQLRISPLAIASVVLVAQIACTSVSYHPVIVPAEFSTVINNQYFTLTPGKMMVFEAATPDGQERIEIQVMDETKEIMGVKTIVYWDRVWLDGELIEDTKDYLAQDNEGNVWYFGEDVDNYEDGELKDHAGSWIAGVDGAQPGIWMKAKPIVGETYRQEYYAGEAEDMADVLSVTEAVTVRGKTYQNCLKTFDYTPLDPDAQEHKYYCPEVGGMVLEAHVKDDERAELVSVTFKR